MAREQLVIQLDYNKALNLQVSTDQADVEVYADINPVELHIDTIGGKFIWLGSTVSTKWKKLIDSVIVALEDENGNSTIYECDFSHTEEFALKGSLSWPPAASLAMVALSASSEAQRGLLIQVSEGEVTALYLTSLSDTLTYVESVIGYWYKK